MKSRYKFLSLSILLISCFAFIQPGLETCQAETDKIEAVSPDTLRRFFTQIDAGDHHSLALKNDGTVWTWGGSHVSKLPEQVQGLTDIIVVSAGYRHSLALKNDGTVWAWGNNSFGQLGDGAWESTEIPVQVKSLTSIIAIEAGGTKYESATGASSINSQSSGFSIALKDDGTVWTWGSNSVLWNDTAKSNKLPQQMSVLTDIIAIAAGGFHKLALRQDGTVWAWGDNHFGQLGNDSHTNNKIPSQVFYLKDIVAISASNEHSMALTKDSLVWTWGDLPPTTGPKKFHCVPTQVKNLQGTIAISAGKDHYMTIAKNGWVLTWGNNRFGQLGNGTTKTKYYKIKIYKVLSLDKVAAISGGSGFSLALKKDGTIWAWGFNRYGELGNGTLKDRALVVRTGNSYDIKK